MSPVWRGVTRGGWWSGLLRIHHQISDRKDNYILPSRHNMHRSSDREWAFCLTRRTARTTTRDRLFGDTTLWYKVVCFGVLASYGVMGMVERWCGGVTGHHIAHNLNDIQITPGIHVTPHDIQTAPPSTGVRVHLPRLYRHRLGHAANPAI